MTIESEIQCLFSTAKIALEEGILTKNLIFGQFLRMKLLENIKKNIIFIFKCKGNYTLLKENIVYFAYRPERNKNWKNCVWWTILTTQYSAKINLIFLWLFITRNCRPEIPWETYQESRLHYSSLIKKRPRQYCLICNNYV